MHLVVSVVDVDRSAAHVVFWERCASGHVDRRVSLAQGGCGNGQRVAARIKVGITAEPVFIFSELN